MPGLSDWMQVWGKRLIVAALLVLFAIASFTHASRLRDGFSSPMLAVRAHLNAASFIFVSFLLVMLFLSRSGPRKDAPGSEPLSTAVCIVGIAAASLLGYVRFLDDPFLFDDFTHLGNAGGTSGLAMLANSFVLHPTAGDFFFRPLGYVSYWIDFHWAGWNPVSWHAWNLVVDFANACLVFVLARQCRLQSVTALVAALVFAIQPTHVEVTGWMAARFDLLAFFFTAISLICINRYLDSTNVAWMFGAGGSALLAVLSKEAAFGLPLLVVCLIPLRIDQPARKILNAAAVIAAVCGGAFLYRLWYLQGIGGYQTREGVPTILRFDWLRTVNGLFFRQWGILFFPVNWSVPPGAGFIITGLLMTLALAALLIFSRPNRRLLVGSVALVLAGSLPAEHLLLIGPDFAGARVLYLSTLGIAFLWAILLQGIKNDKVRFALTITLLLFQFTALQHNLSIRSEAAHLSRQTCARLGDELRRDPRSIEVSGVPGTRHGIYFLGNGLPWCVAIESPSPNAETRISIVNSPAATPMAEGLRRFVWNPQTDSLDEAGSE